MRRSRNVTDIYTHHESLVHNHEPHAKGLGNYRNCGSLFYIYRWILIYIVAGLYIVDLIFLHCGHVHYMILH